MRGKILAIVTTSVLAVMLAGASLTGCTCSGTASATEESTETVTETVTEETETSKTAKQTESKETTSAAESKTTKETSSEEQATSASSDSQKLAETETQPATAAHTHSWYVLDSHDATCSQSGYVTYACSCGEEWTEWTGATGHSYYVQSSGGGTSCTDASWTKYKCSACGDTYTDYGAAGDHVWEWVDTSYYVEGKEPWSAWTICDAVACSACGEVFKVFTPSGIDHLYSAEEEEAHLYAHGLEGVCATIEGVGVDYEVWYTGTPGYTVEDGYYKCIVCGATK